MPYVRRAGEYETTDSSAAGWIVAIVLLIILIGLVFFAFQLHWFGLGETPQTNININQPSGGNTQQQPPSGGGGGSNVPSNPTSQTSP